MKSHCRSLFIGLSFTILFVGLILIEAFLTGCSSKTMEKTIIIPDEEMVITKNKNFQVERLIKIEEYGMARDWIDENNILLLASRVPSDNSDAYRNQEVYNWLQMRKTEVDTNKYENIIEDRIVKDASVSPDKSKTAFTEVFDDNKMQVVVKELGTGKETVITSLDKSTHINWSNNSKYLSVVKMNMIVIYDAEDNSVKHINIIDLNVRYENTVVKISNDGKKALIKVDLELYLIDLNSENLNLENYEDTGTFKVNMVDDNFVFYDNSTILYSSTSGEVTGLFKYNINTKNNELINDNVGSFSTSSDDKIIAFTQAIGEDMYIGSFNGEEITNQTIIFKGRIDGKMWWNTTSDKLLFYGEVNENFDNYIVKLKSS